MWFEMDLLPQFATGVIDGLGRSFGCRFLPWVVQAWSWLRGRKTARGTMLPESLPVLRMVTSKEAAAGIPEGYQLCRYQASRLIETYIDSPPQQVDPGDTLWLVPVGEIWISTGISAGEVTAEAEVAIEFDPDAGLSSLLGSSQQFDRGWLTALVSGGLMGVLTSFEKNGAASLVGGSPATVLDCRERLNQALQDRGLRCTGLRVGSADSASKTAAERQDSTMAELAGDLAKIRSREEWEQLVFSLRAAGVPVDKTAAKELESMRDEVLSKAVNPNQAVTSLAQLTADAFERAGIEEPDLRRWQTVSERLKDDGPEADDGLSGTSAGAFAPAIGLATTKRPWTWHVWSRQEVDRRQLHYTKRTVRHCRAACEQALATIRELPVLRQVRDLNTQLSLIEELLATMPPLDPRTASLKLDSKTIKSLLRSLEEAVVTTERLAKQTENLFKQVPTSPGWQDALQMCLHSTSKLNQLVRDRRTVR